MDTFSIDGSLGFAALELDRHVLRAATLYRTYELILRYDNRKCPVGGEVCTRFVNYSIFMTH